MATIPIMELLSTFPGGSQLRHGQPAAGSTKHGTKCVVQTGLLPAAMGTGVRCSAGTLYRQLQNYLSFCFSRIHVSLCTKQFSHL